MEESTITLSISTAPYNYIYRTMNPFIHLHVHSQYSLLDGQASVKALVDKAISNDMKGLALTDHGNMFGAKEFFNYVNKKNGAVKKERSEEHTSEL